MSSSTEQDPLSVERARNVDRVCTRFEAAWKAAQRPHIEDYLRDEPEAGRPALLCELVALEAEYRRRREIIRS